MESAIDQIYDDFERECEHELWWIKSKERGLGFKVCYVLPNWIIFE